MTNMPITRAARVNINGIGKPSFIHQVLKNTVSGGRSTNIAQANK
jgi:hypothetical protein